MDKYAMLECTRCHLRPENLQPQRSGLDPAHPATLRVEVADGQILFCIIPHKRHCEMLDKAKNGRV